MHPFLTHLSAEIFSRTNGQTSTAAIQGTSTIISSIDSPSFIHPLHAIPYLSHVAMASMPFLAMMI